MPAPLPTDVKQRLQRVMIDRVLPRFGSAGDDPKRQQSAAARALKVHPSAINRIVNKGTGGSVGLIEKVERLLNEPPGSILGYASGAPQVPRFRDLPGFADVLAKASERIVESKMSLTRRDLETAGDYRLSPPPARLTADLLVQLALSLAGEEEPGPRRRPRKK